MSVKNYSGLTFPNMPAGTTPQAGVSIGVDLSGNVVVLSGFSKVVLLSDTSSTPNSTADKDVLTLTIPANGVSAGSAVKVESSGLFSSAALAVGYNFYLKWNGTKVLTLSGTTPTLGVTNTPYWFSGLITTRSVGASGSVAISALLNNASLGLSVQSQTTATFSSLAANTVTFGFNFSSASTLNVLTANQAIIRPF